MKRIYTFLTLTIALVSFNTAYSQCSILTTATTGSTTISGGSTSTKLAVAHNPSVNVYYTLVGNYIQTHSSINGALLNSYYYSSSMRGLWWNSSTSTLEGNGYSSLGIVTFTTNSVTGYVTSATVNISGSGHQPYSQSQGAYDESNNEIIYASGTTIYRYNRLNGNYIGTISMNSMPSSYNLTNYNIVYTGCSGKELGVYDRNNRRLLFINKATGAYVGYSQLPLTAPTPYNWGVSFANDKLWVSDGSSWYSYKVLNYGLQTSSISGPFCDNSTVSINFTINALTFNSGNVFTAQLSDANGNFSSPVSLGSVTSTSAATISGTIPSNTMPGGNYRIRVVSSNPVQTGADNGTNITINVPDVNLGPDASFCPGDTVTLTAPLGVLSYNWSSGGTNQTLAVTAAGTYSVTVSNSVCSKADTIVISTLTSPTPSLSDTVSVCSSSTVLNPGSYSSYVWNTGATSSTLAASNSGVYSVTVTGTNSCTAEDVSFVNLIQPQISSGDTAICSGDSLELNSTVGCYFSLTNISTSNSTLVGAGSYTGDDRSGIAVTPSYVYLTGDNYTVRYTTDLTSPISLTRTDGLFSDLSTGELYTLWGTSSFNYNSITSIQKLNTSLSATGSPIALSQTINAGYGSYMFAGSGYLILWANNNDHFYHIELPSGTVTDLGTYNMSQVHYGSENWATWGVAECNGNGYSVVFRPNTNSSLGTSSSHLTRFDISNSTFSQASTFSSASLSDMACLTYSPWNNRWYFHSEGSNFAGSYSENLGYADAMHNGAGGLSSVNSFAWSTGSTNPYITVSPSSTTDYSVVVSHGSVSCYDTVTITVNSKPTFSLSDTLAFCNVDSGQLSIGTTYSSYAWSNGATSQSTYALSGGYYMATVTNANGCEASDSTYVNLLDARIGQGDTTLCSADSLDLAVYNTCGFSFQDITLNNKTDVYNHSGNRNMGIAITPNYVYSNGTTYCTRYSLDLNSYTNFSRRDGIFSDLASGQLYTFWNTNYTSFAYTRAINSIRKMDASLNYGSTIMLSQAITVGNNSFVAAGNGFVLLYSSSDAYFYRIDTRTGNVEQLSYGTNFAYYIDFYGGWASYGVAECTDNGYSIVAHCYRSLGRGNFRSIGRYTLDNTTWADAWPNVNAYSDITEITYSRWTGRWYATHIGSQSQLGTNSRNILYADATVSNSGGGSYGVSNILWSTADTTPVINVSPNTTTSYHVRVSEGSNICRDTTTITVIQSPAVTSSLTHLSCYADTNGAATLSVSGGTTPYSYAWSTGNITNALSNVSGGTYAYSVTGGNNCVVIDSVTINSPSEIITTATINSAATCYGSADGSATVSVTGGTGPYTYLWPSGATDSTDTQASGGWNVITITDASSCVVTDSVNVTAPAPITNAGPITSTTTFYCPGTSGTLVAANGNNGLVNGTLSRTSSTLSPTPLYNSDMTFTFNALPTNNTSNLTLTLTFTGQLNSSSRYLNIYDENNNYVGRTRYYYSQCSTPNSVSFNINSTSLQNYLQDGSMTFTVRPYVYSSTYCAIQATMAISYGYTTNLKAYWFASPSSDTTQALGSGATLSVAPTQTTTYYAANFGNGCHSDFDSITVIVPPAPNTTYLMNPASICPGETTTINAYGAITYTWPTGDPTISGSGSTATVTPTGNTDYFITITNAFNCSYVDTMHVAVKPSPVGNVLTTSPVSCSNTANGQAVVYATGGQSPYTYSWSNGNTGALQLGLLAGTYTVTITDGGSCTDTLGVTVGGPVPIVFNETVSNVSCNGLNDGSIALAITGGTAPFTYAWSNGQSSSSISSLAPGSYTVTVTDNTSCSHDTTFAIAEPLVLSAGITSTTPETCPGVGNGAITSSASGGTAPYTFAWSNGGNSVMLTNLNGGTYTLTVTDASGCTATTSGTVSTIPSSLASSIGSVSNVMCFNGTDGSATVVATGGASPYTYDWNTGSTNASLSGVTAGTYSVTVTDNNSCEHISNVTITEPSQLALSATTFSDVTCFGLANGSASVTASGATPGYSYLWPDGQTTIANTSLTAGTFYVTVSDVNSCSDSVQVTVNEPIQLAMNPSVTDVSCNGLADGAIATAVTGGTAGYTYLWSTGATTTSTSGLVMGTYTVTITDANNCQIDSSFAITQPNTMSASIVSSTDVMCMGSSTGSATVGAVGGTSPYTYNWSNSATTAVINNLLGGGNYDVTVTDANGCSDTSTVFISEPATLLTVSIPTSTNVLCNSLATGSATVRAVGGGAPYSYVWSNGYTDTANTNLIAGTYTVTVTDAYGCIKTASVTITEPVAMTLPVVALTNVTCYNAGNGSATVFAGGGTPSYTYLWSNGSTSSSISSVGPGKYTLTVTDANACTDTTSVTITEPTDLSAVISNSQNVACNGSASGFAVVTATGGTLPYSYAWDNGATTDSIYNQTSGFYTVTVTDGNGCMDTTLANLTQPSSLVASVASVTNNLCYGDSLGDATVNVAGGLSPYTYAWPNGLTSSSVSTLPAGGHIVTITDANNCQDTTMVTITQPTDVSITIVSQTNPLCFGNSNGEVALGISGGTPGYTYLWSNGDADSVLNSVAGGTFTISVTDNNNCQDTFSVVVTQPTDLISSAAVTDALCNVDTNGMITTTVSGGTMPYTYNWSNGDVTANAINLSANTYTVTITDANGCADTLTNNVSEPTVLGNSLVSFVDVNCTGVATGSAVTSTNGGTIPYTYAWTGGQNVESPTNLLSGINVLTVTDGNGCTDTTTVTLSALSNLDLTLVSATDILCNGDATSDITVTASGGVGTSVFSWSVVGTDSILTNQPAGSYSAYVTDNLGCSDTLDVIITEPTLITGTLGLMQSPLCNGDSNGWAQVIPTGGIGNYTFLWPSGDTTSTDSLIAGGTHTVTITDGNSCSNTFDVVLVEPTSLSNIGFNITNVNCYSDATGSIVVNPIGGTLPYTSTWSNGQTGNNAIALTGGTYAVQVVDGNGCILLDTATVTSVNPLTPSMLPTDTNYCGASLTLTANSAFTSYNWSTGGSGASIQVTTTGSINFSGVDGNGCTTYDTVQVNMFPAAVVNLGNDISNICEGTPQVLDAGNFVSYVWSNGETTQTITVTTSGTYLVTATDANGCQDNDDVVVSMWANPTVDVGPDTIMCTNLGQDAYDIDAGSGFVKYTWSSGGTSQVETVNATGDYSVVVEDGNGCLGMDTVSVTFDICSGIDEPGQALTISMYPNPTKGDLNIDLKGFMGESVEIEIMTTNGQLVKEQVIESNNQSELNTQIDLNGVAQGLYFVVVKSGEQVKIERITIY